jgi:hypothetical protein
LEDQQLFEALAREEPLRELLEDAGARTRLLASLGAAREPWYYRPLGLIPILATASAAIIVAAIVYWWPARRPGPIQVAQVVTQAVVAPSQKAFVPPPRPRAARTVLPSELPPMLPAPVYAPLPRVLAEVKTAPPQPMAMQSASARVSAVMPFQSNLAARPQAPINLPAPFGLRYSVVKTLPTGELTEVDAKQELERNDEVAIRFQANQGGYLYVLEQDPQKNWQPFASQRIQPAMPVMVPPQGSLHAESAGNREFFVVFSRQPQTSLNRIRSIAVSSRGPEQQQVFSIGGFGETRAVITTVSEPASQHVAFPITLKYK